MKTAPLFATALVTFSLSCALQAAPQRYPDRDRYDRDRYDRRYDRYDGGRVSVLAHEVEEVADSIHREAARNNRRPDRDEARMLQALRSLSNRADSFHDQVEDHRREPRRTEREFEALLDTFYGTSNVLRYVEPRPYIDRGMDRIAGLLGELSRYYGNDQYGRWGRDRGWRGYGRRDHWDRDGRYARPRPY